MFFHSHTFTLQLLGMPWSQVSSLLPPGSCLQLLSRIGFSNPTARRFFIQCCQLTLSRFPQALSASQFVHQKKSPSVYTSMDSGGLELTKTDFIRLEDNLIRHRGVIPPQSSVRHVNCCAYRFGTCCCMYLVFPIIPGTW